MQDIISPSYLMKLVKMIQEAIWNDYKSYKEVRFYIDKWHEPITFFNTEENFKIYSRGDEDIDLLRTLHNMDDELLLKIAIDIGVETPNFLPSIPFFKNEIKSDSSKAHDTFIKALKQIESDPALAIGLANSALESIVKDILKTKSISKKVNGKETLYKLSTTILKEFNLLDKDHPSDIKLIGNSLLTVCQSIENLRSEKTDFHGRSNEDLLISDTVYAYLVVNSVTTVGLFLYMYFKKNYAHLIEDDGLPF